MPGNLIHAPRLEQTWYVSGDGRRHSELVPHAGDVEVIELTAWEALLQHFDRAGVPRSCWPIYPANIDLRLSDVVTKNEKLREAVRTTGLTEAPPVWPALVLKFIHSGQLVLFCMGEPDS